jgi:hypothetical protein
VLSRLVRPLTVTLTVGAGRQVTVGGERFPAAGPARDPNESFDVPGRLWTKSKDRILIDVEPVVGSGVVRVELTKSRLKNLHIDAALESGMIVYGGYDRPAMMLRTTQANSKCIECRGGVIICGINPRCQ